MATMGTVRPRWLVATVAVVAGFVGVVYLMPTHIAHSVFPRLLPRGAIGRSRSSGCPWVESNQPAETKVREVLARMTLQQKVTLLSLYQGARGYENETAAIPTLCIPRIVLQDGPAGVAGAPGATELPAPIDLAASWSPALAREYGTIQGKEARRKGIDVVQGPDVNIARVPENGRTFEAYGEDPYLTAATAVADIDGIQSTGAMADVKHFAANNQETDRRSIDERVSQRALHEIYLPAFAAAVERADVATVMCAYNGVNGRRACQNSGLLNGVLDNEFKFKGFVRSDLGAVHDVAAAYDAGLDMLRPGQSATLLAAVRSGRVPMSNINDAVTRVLREMFRFNLFDRPESGTATTNAESPEDAALARIVAEQGTVLLKNAGGLLPLDNHAVHSIAVIGSDAGEGARTQGEGSSLVHGGDTVLPYQAIADRAGPGVAVTDTDSPGTAIPAQLLTPPSGVGDGLLARYYADQSYSGRPTFTRVTTGLDLSGNAYPVRVIRRWSVTWTGTLTAPATGSYTFLFTSNHGGRFLVDDRPVLSTSGYPATCSGSVRLVAGRHYAVEVEYHDTVPAARFRLDWMPPPDPYAAAENAARSADVAIVFAGDEEGEGNDRPNLSLPNEQDTLISRVARANPNVIVVLNTGSAVTMPWLDKVKGVIEAWYPGQEDGKAIAAVLFGDVNPSGKLPITFPKSTAETPAHNSQQWPGIDGTADYSEGIDVGYRWYDGQQIDPLFPFGYGLSYTTFAVHDLVATKELTRTGLEKLSVDVTNTGHGAGAEVVQLYVGMPAIADEPPQQLKGFQKVTLEPGQTQRVRFTLTRADLAYWSTAANNWATASGNYHVMVGTSSRDIAARGTFRILPPKRSTALPH
jgi:beta-glucosidase